MMTERMPHSGTTIDHAYPVERRSAFLRNATLKITLAAKEYSIAAATKEGVLSHLETQLMQDANSIMVPTIDSEQALTLSLEIVANRILKEYIFSHYDTIAQENKGNLGLHAFISSIVAGLEEGWWKHISKKT